MNERNSKIKIAPSILAADFTRLGEQVRDAESAGADMIHIDVMDGRFVPNITMGPLVVEAVRRVCGLPLDVHLMVVEPERQIEAFASAGADRITIHYEATTNVHSTLMQIRALEKSAGIALNPHTPAGMIVDLMAMVDVVNVMTVNPGFGGQGFLPETLPKITQVRKMIDETGREIDLEVDGGIYVQTGITAVRAGANVLIAGSSIFNEEHSVAQGIEKLLKVTQTQR